MRAGLLTAIVLFAVLPWLPQSAEAQVQRCETPDGRTIFTDKACDDVGAVDRVPRGNAASASTAHRRQCARTLQDLTLELTMSIDARDANRLAALYHWPGMGTREGYAIMGRLDAIAQRPVVDVRPVFPEPAPTPTQPMQQDGEAPATGTEASPRPPSSTELMRSASPWRPSLATASTTSPTATPPAPPPAEPERPRARPVPHALQLDQTLANGSTPSRTVFGLRRHLGCWWISL